MKIRNIVCRLLMGLSTLSCSQVPALAQQTCRAYYTSYVYIPVLGLRPGMTSKQEKWLKKKAAKDYAQLCADPKQATFILITYSQIETVQEPATVTRHVYTTGPVTEQVGVTATGGGLPPSQPIWGTRLETFVTTWQEQEMRNVNRLRTAVFLLTTKKPLEDAINADDYYNPVIVADREGRAADRDALRDALNLVNSIANK